MEPDSYEALRRKERWYSRLMVIFFIVGIILSFFSVLYMMVTVSALPDPGEMTPERLSDFEFTAVMTRSAGVLGSVLTTMAFFILVYWVYLKGKREGMEKPREKRKKKRRTWKVLQPRKHD